jgi:hypothetical protein
MLKERMSGTSYSLPDELISVISDLIASLPKDQLVSVSKNWMKSLNWVIKQRKSTTVSQEKCILLAVILTEIARHYELSNLLYIRTEGIGFEGPFRLSRNRFSVGRCQLQPENQH